LTGRQAIDTLAKDAPDANEIGVRRVKQGEGSKEPPRD